MGIVSKGNAWLKKLEMTSSLLAFISYRVLWTRESVFRIWLPYYYYRQSWHLSGILHSSKNVGICGTKYRNTGTGHGLHWWACWNAGTGEPTLTALGLAPLSHIYIQSPSLRRPQLTHKIFTCGAKGPSLTALWLDLLSPPYIYSSGSQDHGLHNQTPAILHPTSPLITSPSITSPLISIFLDRNPLLSHWD